MATLAIPSPSLAQVPPSPVPRAIPIPPIANKAPANKKLPVNNAAKPPIKPTAVKTITVMSLMIAPYFSNQA